jgi:hypothetical protein
MTNTSTSNFFINNYSSYLSMNDDSDVLDDKKILKHMLMSSLDVDIENIDNHQDFIKNFCFLFDHLTSLESVCKRVEYLIDNNLVDENNTLVDEIISANCCDVEYDESYLKNYTLYKFLE